MSDFTTVMSNQIDIFGLPYRKIRRLKTKDTLSIVDFLTKIRHRPTNTTVSLEFHMCKFQLTLFTEKSYRRPYKSGEVISAMHSQKASKSAPAGLYTAEERIRRDQTVWTLIQGILAPLQFAVFLVSLVLVLRYLATGLGYEFATASIVLKTALLYLIMITGAIWEKIVFGQYLFAPAFFWEDVFSFAVIALHTTYLWALFSAALSPVSLMLLALAAYTAYVINAAQFLLKLRAARLQAQEAQNQPTEAPA